MEWHKSSYSSDDGNCVETAALPDGECAVRDSKLGTRSPVLRVNGPQWAAFISTLKE